MRPLKQPRAENLRQIAMPCDFVQRSTFYFDVFNYRQLWSISRVLSLFIDNSSNSKELAVTIFHSGQVIIAQPKTQGYYPVLSYSDTFAMSISSMNSSDTATVYACNYMVPPGSWGPNQTQPISGSVSVTNFPSVQVVEVDNFPATQPVSGSVGVNNFPASTATKFESGFKSTSLTTIITGSVTIHGILCSFDMTSDSGLNQFQLQDSSNYVYVFITQSPMSNNSNFTPLAYKTVGNLVASWSLELGTSPGVSFIVYYS